MHRRLFLASACLLFLAFAVYGSFVPFRVQSIAPGEALERFWGAMRHARWPSRIGSDFVANVLLFVPIGFTLAGALAGRSRALAWAVAVPVAAALGLAASLAIEFGQTFTASRVPSAADVIAETIGAVIGAVTWALFGTPALDWLRPLRRTSTARARAVRLLGLYASVWLLLQVLPFDLELRPDALARKYEQGRIILRPFAGDATLFDAVMAFGTAAVQALPIGALWLLWTSGSRPRAGGPRGAGASRMAPLALTFATVAALELVQVLLSSRTADITDVFAGAIGGAAGVWLAASWTTTAFGQRPVRDGSAPPGPSPTASATFRAWPLVVLAAWLGVLAARHWAPFDFVFSRAMYDSRVRHLLELPFRHYYWSNYLGALGEAWTKILLGVPVGLLLQVAWPPQRRFRMGQALLFLACAAVVFVLVELGQVFVPSRVPDVTDVLLGVLGAAVGVAAVRLVTNAGTDW